MTRVRALDENGDWTFGRGKANYLSGNDAVEQKVLCRLKSFAGDNPVAINAGIDWDLLLSSKNTESIITKEIERIVTSTQGVVSLSGLEIKRFGRNAEFALTVNGKSQKLSG